MKLKVKEMLISSGGPLIAVMHEEDARKLDLFPLDRVRITKDGKGLVVASDIAGEGGIEQGFIGIFREVMEQSSLRANEIVNVEIEQKPESINFIRRKLQGHKLADSEINQILKDIVENKLSEVEISYFVAACYTKGLSMDEIVNLTNAIVKNGKQLKLDRNIVLDKHCVGGIPGNRTTMIIVPIIACAGIAIPKASSRSITSAAGTADTMEIFANVNLDSRKMKEVVEKTNGCIAWGGGADLASADDIIIKMERPLKLDPEGVLLSSIMAKKKAVGATHVLIDIPYGRGAKIETRERALRLRKLFIKLGKKIGIRVRAILTDGSSPIGRGVGPSLEARDVLYILTNDSRAPEELKRKSLMMAGIMLNMAGKGDERTAKQILESGKAYEKFKEIILAQGGNPDIRADEIKIGKFSYVVRAKKSGVVNFINNKAVASIARIAGAPKDKEAGVYLNKKVGEKINIGDVLLTVYASSSKKMNFTVGVFNNTQVIEVI